VPSPNAGPAPFNTLSGVSCPSATACIAVGSHHWDQHNAALIESWNGTTWSIVPSPSRPIAILDGISCISARACTAVGNFGFPVATTLIESWNGTKWTVVPSLNPAPSKDTFLNGVSCPSANACTAVGLYYFSSRVIKTLVESWNGTRWSIVPSPNGSHPGVQGNELTGVSCLSARACTAVGSTGFKTLIESWNGTRWSIVPSPSRGHGTAQSVLFGVSCLSATACTAAGVGDFKTLIESWNGTNWSIVPSPDPGGASPISLAGVSCVSVRACTAVGDVLTSNNVDKTLIESWNGTRWSIVPSPNGVHGSGAINVLRGVSCASAATCTAVGNYITPKASKTLTELGTPRATVGAAAGQPGTAGQPGAR
jgi:hypothetical protein